MSTTTLQRHVRPLSGWEQKVKEALAVSEQCKEFFADRNLEMLSLWVKDASSKRKLQDFVQRGSRDRLLKLSVEQLAA